MSSGASAFALNQDEHQLTAEQTNLWILISGKISCHRVAASLIAGYPVPAWVLAQIEAKYPGFIAAKQAAHAASIASGAGGSGAGPTSSNAQQAGNQDTTNNTQQPISVTIPLVNGTQVVAEGETQDEESGEPGVVVRRRAFSWLPSHYLKENDAYNTRDENGQYVPINPLPPLVDNSGVIHSFESAPSSLVNNPVYASFLESLADINGTAFYDAEATALGTLDRSLYFHVPINWPYVACPADKVGSGLKEFSPPVMLSAGVYAMAKEQALRHVPTHAIQWATLRMSAFMNGWYKDQRQVVRKTAPSNYMETFMADHAEVLRYLKDAHNLCSFLPFLHELNFRSYGATYQASKDQEFHTRAVKLATSAQLEGLLDYLPHENLYGDCLRWIGVAWPMEVLKANRNSQIIPNIFRVRLNAAPSGHAVITSAYAVIIALTSSNWWGPIKTVGHYVDGPLETVSQKIFADPWKYHAMASTYGLPPLSDAEVEEARLARETAIMFAPILQAYLDQMVPQTDLGRIQVLQKHAMANAALFNRAKSIFRSTSQKRVSNVLELFSEQVFRVPVHALEGGTSSQAAPKRPRIEEVEEPATN